MNLYPFVFKPNNKKLVWGTEEWAISAVPGSESIVANGPLEGKSLSKVIESAPEAILGREVYVKYGAMPLLAKIIEAKADLSIQVHPNDQMARRLHNKMGKSEMWYILEAEPGAHLYAGFEKEITPQEYARMIEDGSIIEVLAKHNVNKGDIFYLPAGRVHAICGGITLAEVQQSSDLTYRIYDFKRKDKDGNYRQLHTKEAMECIDYSIRSNNRIIYEKQENKSIEVVDCPYFKTSVCDVNGKAHFDYAAIDSFVIIIATKGNGTITDSEGNNMPLTAGETILLPATNKYIVVEGKMTLIETHV